MPTLLGSEEELAVFCNILVAIPSETLSKAVALRDEYLESSGEEKKLCLIKIQGLVEESLSASEQLDEDLDLAAAIKLVKEEKKKADAAGTIRPKLTKHLNHVGENTKSLRLARDLTQTQLADRAGLHQSLISSIEKKESSVSYKTIARIAVALEVEICELDSTFDSFAQRLHTLRTDRNVSAAKLSSFCDIPIQRIEELEARLGERVTVAEVSVLSAALGVIPDSLDPTYSRRLFV